MRKSTGEIAFLIIVFSLSIAFLTYVGVACYKFARTPIRKPEPPKPSLLEQSVEACKAQNGIPILKYDNGERLERCDK